MVKNLRVELIDACTPGAGKMPQLTPPGGRRMLGDVFDARSWGPGGNERIEGARHVRPVIHREQPLIHNLMFAFTRVNASWKKTARRSKHASVQKQDARRCAARRVSSIMFLYGRLAVPSMRRDLEFAPYL